MKFQDLTGRTFNKLTVVKYLGQVRTGQSRWLCRCDCGNPKLHEALGSHLKAGGIQSCGCLSSTEARRKANTRHGMAYTPEWNSFHAAKKRCKPEQAEKYPDHAGRGIEFRFSGFEDFYAAVGPRPEPKFG